MGACLTQQAKARRSRAFPSPAIAGAADPRRGDLFLLDRPRMGELRGLAKHDRGRAVFLGRQRDGTLDRLRLETTAAELEVELDFGEHLRIGRRTLGVELDLAGGNGFASFLEDMDDIEGGAAAKAQEQQFEWPESQVAAAAFRRAIHDDRMPAA